VERTLDGVLAETDEVLAAGVEAVRQP